MLPVVISPATQTRQQSPALAEIASNCLRPGQCVEPPPARWSAAVLHGAGRHGLTIAGPPLYLIPHDVLAFGMVVHELNTDAVKHGALSVLDDRATLQ